ncbi:MAG: hypothetical protein KF802_10045 [Bdellovibrionaceae bacterium]|nr:hypothetical protein [Pseudobdellovibrionaceae bacterium]MBX3033752.1 hypothetical protein [Pseudobdellovibrionaceae bacterium]
MNGQARQSIRRILQRVSLLAAAGSAAVIFQNCGKAGFDADPLPLTLTSLDESGDTPFAFDAAFDQITYNSCSAVRAGGMTDFFTLKAGAHGSGGVSITAQFRDYLKSGKDLPLHAPGQEPSAEQIKNFLAVSGRNVEAQPQMALRAIADVQKIVPASGSPVQSLLLSDLTDDRWMDPLVRFKEPTLHFDLAPSMRRSLEGKFTFNQSETQAEEFRGLFADNALMLTFRERSDLGDQYAARAPDAASRSVAYGRSYALSFARPGQNPHSNLLSRIEEFDLRQPSAVLKTWNCADNRRYVVMHVPPNLSVEAQAAERQRLCPADPFGYMSDPNYAREMKIVRQHLKAEDWWVSVANRCAIPLKGGSCYPLEPDTTEPQIEYDPGQPCYPGVGGGANLPIKRCAQYVSVCTRD